MAFDFVTPGLLGCPKVTAPLPASIKNESESAIVEFVDSKSSKKEKIQAPLRPGDLLVYRGCDLAHWRDEFKGVHQAQVFCHYNNKKGPYNNVNDGRPMLGVPKMNFG